MATKTSAKSTDEYPMHAKDGRPWIATSKVEVMELMASGYTLDNPKAGIEQAPPAESAGPKGEPATSGPKPGAKAT